MGPIDFLFKKREYYEIFYAHEIDTIEETFES